jgi:hypothetical protein
MTLIKILIVATVPIVVATLFGLAALLGCEDEAEADEPEPTFELVPYSTDPTPTIEGALWLESDEIPPPAIFYYDGNKKIEYLPNPEPDEPAAITITAGDDFNIEGQIYFKD